MRKHIDTRLFDYEGMKNVAENTITLTFTFPPFNGIKWITMPYTIEEENELEMRRQLACAELVVDAIRAADAPNSCLDLNVVEEKLEYARKASEYLILHAPILLRAKKCQPLLVILMQRHSAEYLFVRIYTMLRPGLTFPICNNSELVVTPPRHQCIVCQYLLECSYIAERDRRVAHRIPLPVTDRRRLFAAYKGFYLAGSICWTLYRHMGIDKSTRFIRGKDDALYCEVDYLSPDNIVPAFRGMMPWTVTRLMSTIDDVL